MRKSECSPGFSFYTGVVGALWFNSKKGRGGGGGGVAITVTVV